MVLADDLVILGCMGNGVKLVKEELESLFKRTDLGEMRYYLNLLLE